MDPVLKFGALLRDAGYEGRLNPNSIQVVNTDTGESVPTVVTEDFAYGDEGRVEWVIENPSHRNYEIHFDVVTERPALESKAYIPLIGVGDLLRYNAGEPRPIALPYPSRLTDMTGDGKRDLVGCWNYAYAPDSPWDGIVVYPRVGSDNTFRFGDLARLRYAEPGSPSQPRHFTSIYMQADVADLNGDGFPDIIFSPRGGHHMQVFLYTGRRDGGGLPRFESSVRLPRPSGAWGPCRTVDLNNDGAIDFVVGAVHSDRPARNYYLCNTNPSGWPIALDEAVDLGVAAGACFLDIDGDDLLDAVGLRPEGNGTVHEYEIVWQRNTGGDPPIFDEAARLWSVSPHFPTGLASVRDGKKRGLLVLHNVYQNVSFYEHIATSPPYFADGKRAESLSAVMAFSDQAWPHFCDWDGDGDLDLLVGGGYGWPRIVINDGTAAVPRYSEPRLILADGEPIRILRNEVLGAPYHGHNMGYPYPVYADWDGDGLPDLILPNETNRIFWYKNEGTRLEPAFGTRRQILVEGYPDTDEHRKRSAGRALDATYPLEEERPFFWRTGAAVADWNGDGLMDLATHDGHTRTLTLFAQQRTESGVLVLRKEDPLLLEDGRTINDGIVERSAHWTESFRPVDWDGDGRLDLIYGCAGTEPAKGSVYLLRNVGSLTKPVFAPPRTMRCFGVPIKVTNHGPHPWAGDLDGDGNPDLVACVEWSVYPFYTHAALEMEARPEYELGALRAANESKGFP